MLYAGEIVRDEQCIEIENVRFFQCCRKQMATERKAHAEGEQVKAICGSCGCSALSSPRAHGQSIEVPVWLEKCAQHRSTY